MKALKTGFAKWVGALAIATLAPLAQAIPTPVGSFVTPGINLGPLDLLQGKTLSVIVTGFAPNVDYGFKFVAEGPPRFDIGDLSVSFADFQLTPGARDGDFSSISGTETWLFEYIGLLDQGLIYIRSAEIFCQGTPDQCSDSTNNVPEPGTLMLVGAALLAGAAIRRRKPV